MDLSLEVLKQVSVALLRFTVSILVFMDLSLEDLDLVGNQHPVLMFQSLFSWISLWKP